MASAVPVDDACVTMFNDMKMKSVPKRYIIYKIDAERIVIECDADGKATYQEFVDKLPKDQPRYAVLDFEYTTDDGRPQSKLIFVLWSPDNSNVKLKMVYAASKDNLKRKLVGCAKELQANDFDDMDLAEVTKMMK